MNYKYPTIIEPVYDGKQTVVLEYKVVAQDSCFPNTLYYGTYEDCLKYQINNCSTDNN